MGSRIDKLMDRRHERMVQRQERSLQLPNGDFYDDGYDDYTRRVVIDEYGYSSKAERAREKQARKAAAREKRELEKATRDLPNAGLF